MVADEIQQKRLFTPEEECWFLYQAHPGTESTATCDQHDKVEALVRNPKPLNQDLPSLVSIWYLNWY